MRFDFKTGSGIVIGTDCYRFVERIRDARCSPVFQHVTTGDPRTISDSEIKRLIEKSQIQILTPAEMADVKDSGEPPKGPNVVFLEDIKSEWERARAARYEKYARAWDRAGRPSQSDGKLQPLINRVAREEGDDEPPSPRTLRRFLPTWVARGCTLDGLLSRKNQCGAKLQITGEVREFVLDVIWDEYLTLTRPSVEDCYESLRSKINQTNATRLPDTPELRLPSIRQVRREIAKIDKLTIMARREGPRAALLKFGPRYAGVEVLKHNHRWELDSTVVDLMLIDLQSGRAIDGQPSRS